MMQIDLELPGRQGLNNKVAHALAEMREALHRKGRLSGRNEALDELAKLLFAHVMAVLEGREGIGEAANGGAPGVASRVRDFTADQFARYLPESLEAEMGPEDFALRLKPQEDDLANELVASFRGLSGAALAGRIEAVDLLNEVFGTFLADAFADEKELGQYLTPPEIVTMMARLAIGHLSEAEHEALTDPDSCRDFGLIMDPSCGVGSFLTEVMRLGVADVRRQHGTNAAREWQAAMAEDVLVGVDKSERMVRFALTSLAMFGVPAAKLHLANALSRHGADGELMSSFEGNASLILTNPPFGADFRGRDIQRYQIATAWSSRPPASVNSEILFLERYLDWLRPGGQLLAIVPDSILTNRGVFADLRAELSMHVDLLNVISLPPITFAAAGTTTKTSILHLRKRSSSTRTQATYFAICSNVGYEVVTRGSNRAKVGIEGEQLTAITGEALNRLNPQIGRLVENAEDADRWDATFHSSLPREVEDRVKRSGAGDVKLVDVADLVTDRIDPRKEDCEKFDYIEISGIDGVSVSVVPKAVPCAEAPTRARKRVERGDVLVSTVRPDNRTVGVVGEENGLTVCTTGLAVLRPRGVDPVVLARLLQTDFVTHQIMRNNLGVAYPSVDEACLEDVLLPISRDDLRSLADRGREVELLRRRAAEAQRAFDQDLTRTVKAWL